MRTLEQFDRRVLGALRFVDSTTGLPISSNLRVNANGLKFVRNLSGHYVIAGAAGLEEHEGSFQKPPASPAIGSLPFEVSVDDPNREYLSRRHTIKLPRDPDPKNDATADSLFRAVEVRLFPSSTASTGVGWAVIRASVFKKGTSEPLSGALLRVTKKNGAPADEAKPMGVGLTDRRGEALVAVPGIPVITFGESEGAVTTKEIDVTISAFFDPNAGAVPDPDDLEARRATLKSAKIETKLGSGHVIPMKFEITLP
jgi:hypothetical protein